MNVPPYQWRANTGYRPPQDMYYFQGQPVWLQAPVPCVQYHEHIHFNYPRPHLTLVPPPPPPQKPKAVEEKAKNVEEKKDAEDNAPSVHSAPKTQASKKTATDKPPSGKGSCKSKKTSTKEQNDEEPKPSEKGAPSTKTASSHIIAKRNPATPPSLKNGQNYMFPLEHTRLHILNRAARIWEKKHEKSEFRFNIYKVGTHMTVDEVIQNTMNGKVGGDWEKCKGWAATEIIERGDGKWEKGTTIEYSSDKSKGTLASMGWTAKRGTTLPPVWITVHRFEAKK